MNSVIRYLENEPFSDRDIMKAVDGKANLVLYPDIAKYKTIDALLGKHKACIILYITSDDPHNVFGHWVTIFKSGPKTLTFFDSYAYIFDSQLAFSKIPMPPYLTDLLERCNYDIIYNTH